MKEVAIVGAGQSKFSRACGMRVPELAFEAFKEAMEQVKLTTDDIDASIICSSLYDKQRSAEATISDYLDLAPRPTFLVENACCASTSGVKLAWSLIKSGLHKIVAVIGVEKMSGQGSRETAEMMGRSYDITWESSVGFTMPSGYALHARAYMANYGLTDEQLAKVRVKNSFYGAKNPKAAYQKPLSLEDIVQSEQVASPLKKFDCCANADGASCIILTAADIGRGVTETPVWIIGIGSGSDTQIARRTSYTSFRSVVTAAEQAYRMAGVRPGDIQVAEVHDCFTIAELIAYEDLGFCARGEAVKLIEGKETYVEGKIPVNVDGGLLSKGHPVGATGGSQTRTIVKQLRGEMGETQVKDANIGLVHNVGGVGHYCNVIIFSR